MAKKIKENLKGITELQKCFLSGRISITGSELLALGFDLSNRKFTLRNITLEKEIFGSSYYYFSLVDSQKDLDGNLISENEKLMTRIQTLWDAGKRRITNKELGDFNICPKAMTFDIGNVRLNSILNFTNSYDFEIIDSEKDLAGKWLDSAVTTVRVKEKLLEFKFEKEQAALGEVKLNSVLEDFLKDHFKSVKKSGTSAAGLLDLLIGTGKNKVAVEMKKADKLADSGSCRKCRDQIEQYNEDFGGKMIFLVAGLRKDMDHVNVSSCIDKAKKLGVDVYKMMV